MKYKNSGLLKTSRDLSTTIQVRHVLALTAVVVLGSLFSEGCSSVQNMASSSSIDPGTNACPAGLGGEPAACCDSTGTPLSTPPTEVVCAEAVPGTGPILYHVAQGAASAGGSAGESGAASSLVGGEKANGTQYSGATAGSVPVTAAQNATNPNANLGTSLGNSGSGSTGAGSTTSGNTLAGMGDIMTSPASSPTPDASSGANNSGLSAAAGYGAGGSGGTLPNGAKETGFHFGNGLTGSGALNANGAGDSGNEMKFSDGTNAMSSNDPSDYFTRIGIEDSIFKKVEKRYRSTSENWTAASLSAPISNSARKTASQGRAK